MEQNSLKTMLEQLVEGWRALRGDGDWKYVSYEDFTLQEGRPFELAELTDEEKARIEDAIVKSRCPCAIKECFANAQMLVTMGHDPGAGGDIKYVEGFAIRGLPFPVHHAWAVINDKVVDVTWDNPMLDQFDGGRFYFGKVFDKDDVVDRILANGAWGSMLDDPGRNYPYMNVEVGQCRRNSR